MTEKRVQGCLMGQAIGDALGSTYEFNRSSTIIEDMELYTVSDFLVIVGGGPFNLKPGQITDDTELALALARSILRERKFDREKVGEAYITWYKSPPFDIGRTTRFSLDGAKSYKDLIFNSRDYNSGSLSNGSLMRISPLAIHGLNLTDKQLYRCCVEDCLITHSHRDAVDATQVFVFAIRDALLGVDKHVIMDNSMQRANSVLVKEIIRNSLDTPFPNIYDPVTETIKEKVKNDAAFIGYLGIALQNAFYELFNGTSFYDSMVEVIKRGGDTDTNGAIAGALLGAYYGIDEIPEMWKESVINGASEERLESYPWADTFDILNIADRLYANQG